VLLIYGTAAIFLQLEVPLKLARAVMGYGGWLWGGLSDLPLAWSAPTPLDEPLRALYGALTLKQPLLPWLAWIAGAGALVLLDDGRWTMDHGSARLPPAIVHRPSSSADNRALALALMAMVLGLVIFGAGGWLRAGNLLPGADGQWTGSNFDEMVYYTQAELFTRGAWAYRDVFMAHPPGVVWAFAPSLLFEGAWGGPGAFVAARPWLLAYSLASIPLAWLAGRKLGGSFSGVVAALALALDGKAAFAPQSDRLLPNVGVLETLVNVTSLLALLLYLYAPPGLGARRRWLFAAGAVAGASAMCKLPGAALLVALLVFSLVRRRPREGGWLVAGGLAGAAALALPFLLVAPGQMVRQALFFQLLRPQEVREGIDQAGRIAAYPEAQLTLLLAGLGILAIALVIWRRPREGTGWSLWLLPVLWAAPVLAVFVLSRSFHSQYYTQWVPPLALVAGAGAAHPLWSASGGSRVALAVAGALLALPLGFGQWRVASTVARDEVYRPVGEALARSVQPGEQAMAYDPGYTFAAGLPPARIGAPDRQAGVYLVDTAGYTIYLAGEIDRQPWGALLGRALEFRRERNEEEVLRRPEAQAALLSGALGADEVVLDQKIALPKLSAQSVRLLEGLAGAREEIGFATLLHMRSPESIPVAPFDLSLAASAVSRVDRQLVPVVGRGTLNLSRGEAAQVGLYWRPGSYIAPNLRVVVRLVSGAEADTRPSAIQVDTEPSEGSAHTSTWRPGLVYPDIRNIPLQDLAPGAYSLLVRVYDPATSASSQDVQLPQVLNIR
jgi:hypothetical protein